MTGDELFAIVDPLSRDLWPPLIARDPETGISTGWRVGWDGSLPRGMWSVINADHAVLIFEGHLARILDKVEQHWMTSGYNGGVRVHSACMGKNAKRLGDGPTRLHALIDAAMTVMGLKQ